MIIQQGASSKKRKRKQREKKGAHIETDLNCKRGIIFIEIKSSWQPHTGSHTLHFLKAESFFFFFVSLWPGYIIIRSRNAPQHPVKKKLLGLGGPV